MNLATLQYSSTSKNGSCMYTFMISCCHFEIFSACLLKDGRWDRVEHYCNEVGVL